MTIDAKKLSALAIHLHGRRIGVLSRLGGDQQIFSFEQDYIDDPARPTLSLSYKSRTGGLLTVVQRVHRRVPAYFSNLLPEGHLRTYLAAQAGVNPEREFFLLAALGADLTGAVTVTPLDHSAIVEDDPAELPQTGQPGPLRFSLAGVQLKFSAIVESTGGLTIPLQGIGGSWIVKLPSLHFEAVSENAFVMLALARAIGIEVPSTRLVPVKDITGLPPAAAQINGNALAVERFDRGPGGQRIQMEDFAQIFGIFPESKYKSVSSSNIARVLWAETGEAGTYEFIKRLVFSILIGNADMHLKNWSVLYPDSRTPVLAPAYDFVATLLYIPDDQLALTFGGSRDIGAITLDQIRHFTDKAALPMAPIIRLVRDTAEATAAAWPQLAEKDLLPAALRVNIGDQIQRAARIG